MAIEYTWKILQMERSLTDGGVLIVHWHCSGTDTETGNTASCNGADQFLPDPASESYVPYESLTEETVISWITKSTAEQEILEQINQQSNPQTATGLPW